MAYQEERVKKTFGTLKASILIVAILGSASSRLTIGAETASPSYTYYDIKGQSARELSEAMDRFGPLGKDGKRYHGHTEWKITWEYTFTETDASCHLDSFHVAYEVTITIPRWLGYDRSSRHLKANWDKYLAALLTHENGHKDIGWLAAEAIKKEIGRIKVQRTCIQLETMVKNVAEGLADGARAENEEYDVATDHGKTQGATFH